MPRAWLSATRYKWRLNYGGMDASLISDIMTRVNADVSIQNDLLKEGP